MLPTRDQIERAAYDRWLRRSGEHGHDQEDWIAAENELIFALNYKTIAHFELNGRATRVLGDPARRKCRFCEQSSPQVSFRKTPLAIPSVLGNTSLVAGEECDGCHAAFQEHLDQPFEAFARPFLAEAPGRAVPGGPSLPASSIPVAAYKCLVKMALTLLPEAELPSFEDTIEWVCNPNHRQDFSVLRGLSCRLYLPAFPLPAPWTSLARRIEDDSPFPAMLFLVTTPNVVFQVPIPLGSRDDEIDGEEPRIPTLAISSGVESLPWGTRSLDLPIASPP